MGFNFFHNSGDRCGFRIYGDSSGGSGDSEDTVLHFSHYFRRLFDNGADVGTETAHFHMTQQD